jgi:hypothetical protein
MYSFQPKSSASDYAVWLKEESSNLNVRFALKGLLNYSTKKGEHNRTADTRTELIREPPITIRTESNRTADIRAKPQIQI